MIILDTDHLSELQLANSPRGRLLETRLSIADDREVRFTIISFEEQTRGWLAKLNASRDAQDQARWYGRLARMLDFYQSKSDRLLVFDEDAAVMLDFLKSQKVPIEGGKRLKQLQVGASDLKIASIALVYSALLLSANLRHFRQIPGLRVEDWLRD